MLEGKKVNLKVVEKEDLPNLLEWFNNYRFLGEYIPLLQKSKTELELALLLRSVCNLYISET